MGRGVRDQIEASREMRRYHQWSVLLIVLLTVPLRADTVLTVDGSEIQGVVKAFTAEKLIIETEFAGEITIDGAKIKSVKTDRRVNVNLSSGDRLVGTIEWVDGPEAPLVHTAMGPIPIRSDDITGMWDEGAEDPAVVASRTKMEAEIQAAKPKWSATLEAGGVLTEGNTETLNARGRFDVRRKSPDDLLHFYLAAQYSEQDDIRSQNEYLGGVRFEATVTERWYWYTRLELEFDEFENLDLRATAAAGVGYYWLKKPEHELKTSVGAGYRHESYDSGRTTDEAVIDLGLDYRADLAPWVQFTHSTVYNPAFEDFDDYRLRLDTALLLPFAGTDDLKLKLGVKNEYNSRPVGGLERLDNTYYANVVWQIK
jgi:putative salt-induced outer membrane protein YdiY